MEEMTYKYVDTLQKKVTTESEVVTKLLDSMHQSTVAISYEARIQGDLQDKFINIADAIERAKKELQEAEFEFNKIYYQFLYQ